MCKTERNTSSRNGWKINGSGRSVWEAVRKLERELEQRAKEQTIDWDTLRDIK
jgi:hypothetical protein